MIKNVFLPEKFGSYYIFSKRIIGIDIGKTHINATKVFVKGHNTKIELVLEEKIEPGTAASYSERAAQALKNIFARIGKYDEIRTALSSSVVMFKELQLPFITREKINLVINFEVEPLLPFKVNDAVIDFIITKKNKEAQSSQVLVAAVQNRFIEEHLELFAQAGINPHIITVDMFALYSVYKKIPSYAQLPGGIALLDIGFNATRIAYIENGQLRIIRNLSKGMSQLAKMITEKSQSPKGETLNTIIRFGLEKADDEHYNQEIRAAVERFWKNINLTLTSFVSRADQKIEKILLLGGGAQIKGLPEFITEQFKTPCELFDALTITKNTEITIKNTTTVTQASLICTSAALPTDIIAEFNLRKNEFALADQTLVVKQLLVAFVLVSLLFGTLITHYIIQTNRLKAEVKQSEKEVVEVLKQEFDIEEEDTMDDVIDLAEEQVQKAKETWFAFSSKARSSFLQYLLELVQKIDKENLGFSIEKLSMAEGTLVLKARVKDYEALKILERELRKSELFSYVEPQDTPDFTMKISLAPTVEE